MRSRQGWRDFLGEDAKCFVTMVCVFRYLGEVAIPTVTDPTNPVLAKDFGPHIDWPTAYRMSTTRFARLLTAFDPSWVCGEIPQNKPVQREAELRRVFRQAHVVLTKVEGDTDQATGMIKAEALATGPYQALMDQGKSEILGLQIEIKALVHNMVAAVKCRKSMLDLLADAERGETRALQFVLAMNPSLVYLPAISQQVQRRVATRKHNRILKATHPILLQRDGIIALILLFFWDAGFRRLTYREIHSFLKHVGLPSSPLAVERSAQRLDLKKNVR